MSVVPPGSRLVLHLENGDDCEMLTVAESSVTDWAVVPVVAGPERNRPISGVVELVTPEGVIHTPARLDPRAGRLTLSMPENIPPLQRRMSERRQVRLPILGTATVGNGRRMGFRGNTVDMSDTGLQAQVRPDRGGALDMPLTDVFAGLLVAGRVPVGLGLKVVGMHADLMHAQFTFIAAADMEYLRQKVLAGGGPEQESAETSPPSSQ